MKYIIPFIFSLLFITCSNGEQDFYDALSLEGELREKQLQHLVQSRENPWSREALLLLADHTIPERMIGHMDWIYSTGDRDDAFLRLYFRELCLQNPKKLPPLLEEGEQGLWQDFYREISKDSPFSLEDLLSLPQGPELRELLILKERGLSSIEKSPQFQMVLDIRLALLDREYGMASQTYDELLVQFPSLALDGRLLYYCWYPLAIRNDWSLWTDKLNRADPVGKEAFALGRIFRYHQQWELAARYFKTALYDDRSLWYEMDCLLNIEDDSHLIELTEMIRKMEDISYFDDKLEQLLHRLVIKEAWTGVNYAMLLLVEGAEGPVTARYMWVLARAIERGLYTDSAWEPRELYQKALERDPLGWYGQLSRWILNQEESALDELPREHEQLAQWMNFSVDSRQNDLPEDFINSADRVVMSLIYRGMDQEALSFFERRRESLNYPSVPLMVALQKREGDYYQSIHTALWGQRQSQFMASRSHLEYLHPHGYAEEVNRWAQYYTLDPWLIHGLVRVESAYDREIVSRSGAVGLGQLMVPTAEEHAAMIGIDNPDLTDPDTNLQISSRYITWLLDRPYVENMSDMLIAYNGGPGNLRRWKDKWGHLPPELFAEAIPYRQSREYSNLVFTAALYYGYLYGDISPEEYLEILIPQYKY